MRAVAVIGTGQTVYARRRDDVSQPELCREAARLALAEGGIAHDHVFVDIHFRLSQQQPDYVRINPGMTVPTLMLADRILDQSRDIAEYSLGSTPDRETKTWLDLHYG